MLEFLATISSIIGGIGAREFIDILIVTVLIYLAILFVKETKSFFIFTTLVILSGIIYLSGVLELGLTRTLFQPFLTFFILIIIIVFQKEIRRFFEWFSMPGERMRLRRRISASAGLANKISQAVSILVKNRTGAIIVLAGDHPLEHSILGGIELEGKLSVPLLLSIFDTKTPGHDGAVIISDGQIKYFGAHLPLAQFKNLDKAGTRHRAALGLSEETDSLCIVVSEEHGTVSLAQNGSITKVTRDEFKEKISDFVCSQASIGTDRNNWWKYLIIKNWIEKLSSFLLAIILWVIFIF